MTLLSVQEWKKKFIHVLIKGKVKMCKKKKDKRVNGN